MYQFNVYSATDSYWYCFLFLDPFFQHCRFSSDALGRFSWQAWPIWPHAVSLSSAEDIDFICNMPKWPESLSYQGNAELWKSRFWSSAVRWNERGWTVDWCLPKDKTSIKVIKFDIHFGNIALKHCVIGHSMAWKTDLNWSLSFFISYFVSLSSLVVHTVDCDCKTSEQIGKSNVQLITQKLIPYFINLYGDWKEDCEAASLT